VLLKNYFHFTAIPEHEGFVTVTIVPASTFLPVQETLITASAPILSAFLEISSKAFSELP
jgi:hypothetical protein